MDVNIPDLVTQFVGVTDSSAEKARSYLKVSDYNLEQAIALFFDTGGADIEGAVGSPPPLPTRSAGLANSHPIDLDDDDDGDDDNMDDDDILEAMRASNSAASTGAAVTSYEDDEAMARRLQEEFYGSGGGGAVGGMDGVRAPLPRTRETLVGPDLDDNGHFMPPSHMIGRRARSGIFNQQTSVWGNEPEPDSLSPGERRRRLAAATGGASTQGPHAGRLAELFRPPVEIITHLPFDEAMEEAQNQHKWILVNIQEESVFDSQTLNRDIWKNEEVQETVKQNFVFLQWNRVGRDGRDYVRLYIPEAAVTQRTDLFPHIAIIDPRTGEQVKVWKEVPTQPMEFVHTIYEFLERYSLNEDAKNPVQRTAKPKQAVIDVDRMTEDEMLQLAMQNSLDPASSSNTGSPQARDPDELTREAADLIDFEPRNQTVAKEAEQTPFMRISGGKHHQEPPNGPNTTRIQFKLHDGSRVVRRFLLKDTVERLFEYVKADLLPEKEAGKEGGGNPNKEFELVGLGKRLIEVLDKTVEEAGLRMGTIMVESMED